MFSQNSFSLYQFIRVVMPCFVTLAFSYPQKRLPELKRIWGKKKHLPIIEKYYLPINVIPSILCCNQIYYGGEGGIRTHVPLRTTAFRVRRVTASSLLLHAKFLRAILNIMLSSRRPSTSSPISPHISKEVH